LLFPLRILSENAFIALIENARVARLGLRMIAISMKTVRLELSVLAA